jgi:hypothetical protein
MIILKQNHAWCVTGRVVVGQRRQRRLPGPVVMRPPCCYLHSERSGSRGGARVAPSVIPLAAARDNCSHGAGPRTLPPLSSVLKSAQVTRDSANRFMDQKCNFIAPITPVNRCTRETPCPMALCIFWNEMHFMWYNLRSLFYFVSNQVMSGLNGNR